MPAYDFTFKLILIGDEIVDKSAITKRYCYNIYDPFESLTIGVDFHVKLIELQKKKIKLQIWDVGGEERFKFLLPTYFLGADAAFLLYDITKSQTLDNISEWVNIVRQKGGNIPIMLIGTNLDLAEEQRVISTKQGKLTAKKYNFSGFAEVSAKTGQNVNLAFKTLVEITLADAMRRRDKKKKKRVGRSLPPFPSTLDPLDVLLKKLLAAIPEVQAVALVSKEGLPIVSVLQGDVNEKKIAAITAALCSLAKKAISEIKNGDFDQLYIGYSDGYLLVRQVSPDAILIASADKDIRLGRFFPGGLFPYNFRPPDPPDDLDGTVVVQVQGTSTPDESEIDRYCKYCGAPLNEGVSVCPNCKNKNP
jgi:small GTP-binding protein